MNTHRHQLVRDGKVHLDVMAAAERRPDLFEPGELLCWDDPHISEQMLRAHLNPDIDAAPAAASYRESQ
ncbi:MAG: hypothetical protein M3281_05240 [Chloroflexota bacterium]|nr:hypothetical protein [Chloroflexota bacterium]